MKRICIVPAFGNMSNSNISSAVIQASQCFDNVIFSSDSERYVNMVTDLQLSNVICSMKKFGPITDEKTFDETGLHYFKQYSNRFSQIWMIFPTYLNDRVENIKNAQRLLDESENVVDGIVSVSEFDYCPYLGLQIKDGFLCDWHDSKPREKKTITDSVLYQKIYKPNNAFVGKKMKSFEEKSSWLRGNIKPYIMTDFERTK